VRRAWVAARFFESRPDAARELGIAPRLQLHFANEERVVIHSPSFNLFARVMEGGELAVM
jgi:hypothetical protein